MRVLHVISDQNIGGAGILLSTLLKTFDKECVQSFVALPHKSLLYERLSPFVEQSFFLKHPCDRISVASVRELKHIIAESGADIVHTNAALSARIAGKLCGRAVVHTRHCCFEPQGIWKSKMIRSLGGRWNRFFSDRVIATADAAVGNLLELGIPIDQIKVILNGSLPIREVSDAELEVYRKKWGIEEEDFTVGICARLEACKGQDIFLRAAKRVINALPSVRFRFLVVGCGSWEHTLKEQAKALGISDSVCFTGFVEDMAPVYRLLRVNVNCSVGTETSCLALSEGMSASLPMVVSDYGGNAAMIGESKAGILFAPKDDIALANAIIRLSLDQELEQEMKRAAKERYEQNYTAVQMTEQTTAVYEELLNCRF